MNRLGCTLDQAQNGKRSTGADDVTIDQKEKEKKMILPKRARLPMTAIIAQFLYVGLSAGETMDTDPDAHRSLLFSSSK
jgi:hypothetical protein